MNPHDRPYKLLGVGGKFELTITCSALAWNSLNPANRDSESESDTRFSSPENSVESEESFFFIRGEI